MTMTVTMYDDKTWQLQSCTLMWQWRHDLNELMTAGDVRTIWNAAEHVEYVGSASAA